jgi:Ceramidase
MNTYSNIGMFIVGSLLLYKGKTRVERNIGVIAFVIGISSAAAHATQLKFGSMMDYISQFLLFAYIIGINTNRLWGWDKRARRFLVVGIVFGSLAICLIEKHLGLIIFGVLSGVLLISEYLSLKKDLSPDRHALVVALSFLAVGLVCFALDAEKIGCYPNQPMLQMHSAWHLLAAACIFYTAKYYRQFNS